MRVSLVRPLLSPLVLYFSTVYRAVRPRALPVRDSDETLRLPKHGFTTHFPYLRISLPRSGADGADGAGGVDAARGHFSGSNA
jgi:hypothetical protein